MGWVRLGGYRSKKRKFGRILLVHTWGDSQTGPVCHWLHVFDPDIRGTAEWPQPQNGRTGLFNIAFHWHVRGGTRRLLSVTVEWPTLRALWNRKRIPLADRNTKQFLFYKRGESAHYDL